MKKIKFVLGVIVLVLTLSIPASIVKADDVDQFCDDAAIAGASNSSDLSAHTLSQSFTPTKSTLTSLGLAIIMGADFNKSVSIEIRKASDNSLAGTASATGTTALVTWVIFSFDNLALENTSYKIIATTTSSTAAMVYSDQSCYANGMAYIDSVPMSSWDFGFYTEAHGDFPASSSDDSTVASDDPTSSDDSSVTSSISAPTNVEAVYTEEEKVVKLSWKKSATSSIDGYKIYRSIDKNKGYKLVGTVKKNVLEHKDEGLDAATYYYFIRAYKGSTTSANSKIVSVDVPEIVEEAVTDEVDLEIPEAKEPTLWQKIIGPYSIYTSIVLFLIAAGLSGLLYYLIRKRKLLKGKNV